MQWTIFAFIFNFSLIAIIALLVRNMLGQRRMTSGKAPLGQLDPLRIPKNFARTLKGEKVQFWEQLRGWDLQDKPLHVNQRGLINRAIITEQRVLYAFDNGRRLRLEFDFALAGVDRLNLQPVVEDFGNSDAVFIEVHAGEVLHYLLARKDFAQQLAAAATVAKQNQLMQDPELPGS